MFKRLVLLAVSATVCSVALAAVESKPVTYTSGGTQMKGVLVHDPTVSAIRPGVLIVPEYWGLNDYATSRARQIAELGYVTFVADMYGDGKVASDSKQAGQWAGEVKANRPLMRERALAALQQLASQPGVDKDKLAAIGYCFGGTTVLEMARGNAPVRGVVSFHGGLETGNAGTSETITPKVLVLHGAADPHVSPESVQALYAELTKARADWQFVAYSDAVHAFTNPGAGSDPSKGAAYNQKADKRSWQAMIDFFNEIFERDPNATPAIPHM